MNPGQGTLIGGGKRRLKADGKAGLGNSCCCAACSCCIFPSTLTYNSGASGAPNVTLYYASGGFYSLTPATPPDCTPAAQEIGFTCVSGQWYWNQTGSDPVPVAGCTGDASTITDPCDTPVIVGLFPAGSYVIGPGPGGPGDGPETLSWSAATAADIIWIYSICRDNVLSTFTDWCGTMTSIVSTALCDFPIGFKSSTETPEYGVICGVSGIEQCDGTAGPAAGDADEVLTYTRFWTATNIETGDLANFFEDPSAPILDDPQVGDMWWFNGDGCWLIVERECCAPINTVLTSAEPAVCITLTPCIEGDDLMYCGPETMFEGGEVICVADVAYTVSIGTPLVPCVTGTPPMPAYDILTDCDDPTCGAAPTLWCITTEACAGASWPNLTLCVPDPPPANGTVWDTNGSGGAFTVTSATDAVGDCSTCSGELSATSLPDRGYTLLPGGCP